MEQEPFSSGPVSSEPVANDEPFTNDEPVADDEPFTNEPLDVDGLPALVEEEFLPLDPNYLRVRWIGDAIFAAVVTVAAITSAILSSSFVPLAAAAVLLLLTALTAWLQGLEVSHLGYLVRDKDFSYRRGIISRNVRTVPFARVQHVSIDRGPIERYFGMATLDLRTAGGGLTVGGLSEETANRLKVLVVDRAGVAAAEETAEP
ncbi:MAG: PH domain-containing protein [Actinomycetota bacterium]